MSLRRNPWFWIAIAAGGTIGVLLILIASVMPISSDRLRDKVTRTLAAELESEVELDRLTLRLIPLHAEGAGLVIRHRGRHDVPPLITIRSFIVDMQLRDLLRRHVTRLRVDGLDIQVPPGNDDDDGRPGTPDPEEMPDRATPTTGSDAVQPTDRSRPSRGAVTRVVVDQLLAKDARLVILPDEPSARPKVWAIHQLRMTSVSADHAMPFDATLTNAVPPGEIETAGHFGPWQSEVPGRTPLDGRFAFARADLGVFKGISGTLSARGNFAGSLARIDIHGETDTPDFTVSVGGHPMPLHAAYHSIVDGTNGNTILERIDATFLDTSLLARGSVIDVPNVDGRTVKLHVTIDRGRIEDVLRMAVNTAKPPMRGALKLDTAFLLPPGEADVVKRLQLDGHFRMGRVKFTDLDVQKRINELSTRSRGKPQPADARPEGGSVVSDFSGRFALARGTLTLPSLTFAVPGAAVQLAGRYALVPGTLDFTGTLRMQAKISETTTGLKRLLLKVIDPLFSRKGGGSEIPIKITGRRSDPQFGLDKGRIFRRGRRP